MGWAEAPRYDSVDKKLYWAKDLLFDDENGVHTLNYDVRIPGRKGTLVMTAVSNLEHLSDVAQGCKLILGDTEFNEGHAYSDFKPGMDKVAAYGIGGLIAGKLALKAGFFKVILIFLAKFWELILVAVVAIGGALRKVLSGRKDAVHEQGSEEQPFDSEEEQPEA
ncbi:MAG: DUF2167 domain-containing protein [bacterium]|nr:DUF2167 domain-containing protein [bacterium]